jgi:hypothetical protein
MIDIPYLDTSIEGFMNEQLRIHKEFSCIKLDNYIKRDKLIQTKLKVIQ